ncbi:MAG: hypothetical protein KJS92_01520 [Bacteroidetes bacterium]|nr:hypothetical protein [Bacteroidota bacterium]
MEQGEESLLNTRNQGLTSEEANTSERSIMPALKIWLRPAVLIPLGLVTFVLLLLYVANQLHAGKALKRKEQLKSGIKELRAEFISIESDMMVRSRQSQVAVKLQGTGVKALTKPPIKLEKTKKDDDGN